MTFGKERLKALRSGLVPPELMIARDEAVNRIAGLAKETRDAALNTRMEDGAFESFDRLAARLGTME